MKLPTNLKRLLIIIFISFLIIGAIIYFTANRETLNSIKNISVKFFLLGIFFYLLQFSCDALRTQILIKGTNHKLGLLECYRLVAFQIFFDLITPFSLGGTPFVAYVLHKKRIPGGSATTVVILKLIFSGMVLVGIVLWAILSYSEVFNPVPIFKYLVVIMVAVIFIMIVLFILSLYNLRITIGILKFILKIAAKLRFIKDVNKYKNKIIYHLVLAKKSFKGLISHKVLYLILGLLLSFFMYLFMILMILCFIWGFGIKLNIFTGIAITGALYFLIPFMPTPGSSGLGEGIFFLLYKQYIPGHLLGVIIFLWRLFHPYLSAFLGVLAAGYYGSELLSKKKVAPHL